MNIHTDFTQRVALQSNDLPWMDSPLPGVRRRLLERDGGELARATSIVSYAANSCFSLHHHDLGEEIFVLEGELEDESGFYPAGTYIRNPPGSSHAPQSRPGCTLFVKLRHMQPDDAQRVVVHTRSSDWFEGRVPGLSVLPLAEFGAEHTALVRWMPGTQFNPHRHYQGEEIFVIEGVFEDEHGSYPAGSWLRSPHLSHHCPFSTEGCLILVKTGHLV